MQTGLVHGSSAGSPTISASVSSYVYAQQVCSFNSNPCPLAPINGSSTGTVIPTISQDQNLWYFNGNSTPSGFTLGSTSATLTASGGGAGTYAWSITSGGTIATLQGTTSGQNVTSVQIESASYSTTENDVTVQLQFEPTGGTQSVQTSYSLSVDSPYKLISNGSTNTIGVTGSCSLIPAASGTSGFQTTVPYSIISFLGSQISHIQIAESFSNHQPIYTNENWPFQAGTFTTPDGTFVDNICADGSLTPHPLPPPPPPSPPSNTAIDQLFQTWTVGGGTAAPGLSVQTDTLRRYIDHGVHTGITSPTR